MEEMKADIYELLDLLYYYRATPNSIYNIPKIPLEIDVIKNLEDITTHWIEKRPHLADKLEEKKTAWKIILNQKLQRNKTWRKVYFGEWNDKLKHIPNRYVANHFGKRRRTAFYILKYAPFLYRFRFIDKLLSE